VKTITVNHLHPLKKVLAKTKFSANFNHYCQNKSHQVATLKVALSLEREREIDREKDIEKKQCSLPKK